MTNQELANRLKQHARRLASERVSLYRVTAYRRAAEAIERLTIPAPELVRQQGIAGLRRLPGVGDHLAFAIDRLIKTGDYHALHDEADNEGVRSLKGVGPRLAEWLWETLHIRSIPELEQAIRDNRPELLALGLGRLERLRQALNERAAESSAAPANEPPVAALLALDDEYRILVERGQLPTIAPHKYNPFSESWLPLHSVQRDGWRYRVMFSNTALAHRLGRMRDWVVVYFSNGQHHGQRTIVTEKRGRLLGQRVVRGREAECRAHYEQR